MITFPPFLFSISSHVLSFQSLTYYSCLPLKLLYPFFHNFCISFYMDTYEYSLQSPSLYVYNFSDDQFVLVNQERSCPLVHAGNSLSVIMPIIFCFREIFTHSTLMYLLMLLLFRFLLDSHSQHRHSLTKEFPVCCLLLFS